MVWCSINVRCHPVLLVLVMAPFFPDLHCQSIVSSCREMSCLCVSGSVTWPGCHLLLFSSLWWTSNDCSLRKEKKKKGNRNWKTKQMWSDTWAVMQTAQHWMKFKFCAFPITFSFFLCLFPGNFAVLSLVFSYRTLHRDIGWAHRMKNHLLPSSGVVTCHFKYLWDVKVDF